MSVYVYLLIFCVLDSYYATEYSHERAMVKYYNPKYVSEAHVFTMRRGRNGIYSTNGSFTNLHDWNNNVTFKVAYKILQRDVDFIYNVPICDMLTVDWLTDHIKQTSDIPMKCPLQKGKHHVFNFVSLPKKFPFPLPKGDTNLDLSAFITKTQENLIQFSISMHLAKKILH